MSKERSGLRMPAGLYKTKTVDKSLLLSVFLSEVSQGGARHEQEAKRIANAAGLSEEKARIANA